jgi:hypothetical protein
MIGACAECGAACAHACGGCAGETYCSVACQRAAFPEHARVCGEMRDWQRGRLSATKAREMLFNPPRGRALTPKQRRFFEAVAHGWHPTHASIGRSLSDLVEDEFVGAAVPYKEKDARTRMRDMEAVTRLRTYAAAAAALRALVERLAQETGAQVRAFAKSDAGRAFFACPHSRSIVHALLTNLARQTSLSDPISALLTGGVVPRDASTLAARLGALDAAVAAVEREAALPVRVAAARRVLETLLAAPHAAPWFAAAGTHVLLLFDALQEVEAQLHAIGARAQCA